MKQPVFSEVKDDPVKEARLKHTWRVLSELWIGEPWITTSFSAALIRVAKSSCSIPLAKELIELGADLDHPRTEYTNGNSMTALRAAAKKTTKEAALFMQFLLSQGADGHECDHRTNTYGIGSERGPREISKWLGVTWEELVKSNALHCANRLRKKRGFEILTPDEFALSREMVDAKARAAFLSGLGSSHRNYTSLHP